MIIKERSFPLEIECLEALLKRIDIRHVKRKEITDQLAKYVSGYKGEQSLDYYLALLPEDYLIIHHLRLKFKEYYFQIDTLILTPFFFIIAEVKNLSGKLHFDHIHHQLIRTANQNEEIFQDPLLQAKRQRHQLVEWLKQYNIKKQIPIEPIVVITHQSAHIHADPSVAKNIIKNTYLIEKVKDLQSTFKEPIFTKKELQHIAKLLVKHHSPKELNLLESYHLLESELLTGVHCPQCNKIPMEHHRGNWTCLHCGYQSKEAHLGTIRELLLLTNQKTLTNQQLRKMLNLTSASISRNYLKSMSLTSGGSTRNRVYFYELT
ncbi:nuclease-related domain-containing protein [Bacillus sp. PS06]|uniref:nuclease-related domain-containing protein n=1 Tax=Bacillus sp. PS06 TaxID=2764176 RepID=UPI0017848061|nr:nuclease-related domain-containing protein [Bacillus sp. PS06]MBD8069520.1 NERD domain-containing protein [Bacillus sp. PS06]